MIDSVSGPSLSSAVERSLRVFPAGSNGEFDLPPELSIVVSHGEGERLWDAAGREYLDFSMGWGSALVGHAREEVVAAVTRQAARGSNFAYVTEASLALAEELCRVSPACDQVRFCASGTEAAMYCLRLARAFTGRDKVLRFEGAYHGANIVGVTSLMPSGERPFPLPEPTSAGIPAAALDDVLVAPFNDSLRTARIIEEHAEELGAVIVEPLQRCTPPRPNFLEELAAVCIANDVPLVFDEVVTGFRLDYGGAQEYYGVVPDLVAYGKALGGGYPIGAFGGRKAIMDLVREDRLGSPDYVWTASSLGGNPVSCSAARAALDVLAGEGVYPRLHTLGRYLRAGLSTLLGARGVEAQVIGDGPLAQVVFTGAEVVDYRSARTADRERGRALMLGLFRRGVFLNPMGTKLYLSLAHTERTCDAFLDRFDAALDEALRV